jgi:hypothetical protein
MKLKIEGSRMIRYKRKNTIKAKSAIESLKIAKAKGASYNTPEVNAALAEMFHGKCYICENKDSISSFQIEHLKSHHGNIELKYDWNNLFLSCAHCNNIKNDKYEPILDCSKIDVDRKIAFRKEGYFGRDEKFEFIPIEEGIEIKNTVALLYDSYYGKTPQKKMEATNIRRALRRNLSDFKNLVREYDEAEDYNKEDLKYAIQKEVSSGAAFTAFKRWLLWDNKEKYGELLEECGLV